ncbi:uncharacterized protein CC84DRAFT_495861 [Paraphaeosphaeria sporulosa]|uniref:Transcription factor domain-containing protein n=1 Tax=Paraphaeosphaeria sporulosa TaxID=1460663 RepID=A0A177CUC4_9PLEO|nr:uncharacterized protein CC84DRAFT_495861 [Paraphaeosphaeria sporulosa]OAG10811.1 hypothetical protein CC84DRAFT_495861 [Paraphaeosphaeria sporulosa]
MATGKRNTGTDLPFIVSVGQAKVDPAKRKFIRSHVMRGKNRTKEPKPQVNSTDRTGLNATSSSSSESQSISRWSCSKFSGIRFADTIEPAFVEDIFTLLSVSSKAMFLLDQCIIPNEDGFLQAWISPLLSDPAYLHVACVTSQAFFDNYAGRTPSAEARRQEFTSFDKSIRILSKRIATNDRSEVLAESNLMTVLLLSGYSYARGDHKAAHQHNVALIKLVKLKGTQETLRYSPKILVQEIVRTDFCICYENGQRPALFTYEAIPWPLILPPTDVISSRDAGHIESRLDPKLSSVWAAMSHFCAMMNIAARNPTARVTAETFLQAMSSILYRLLHLRFEEDTLNETFRLAILAIAAPTFLDWKTVYWLNGHFTLVWRQALETVLAESTFTPRDRVWLLMVGTLSFAHDLDFLARLIDGLRTLTEHCEILTWNALRELLGSYMWIGTLFDKPGAGVFEAVSADTGKTLSLTRRYNGEDEVMELLDTRPYSKNLKHPSRRNDREYKIRV